jgi:D-3-phosphoglycerate dehydrogenase
MKLLAISDVYIPEAFMRQGLEPLEQLGVEVETRPWEHASLAELQEANLAIETGGPEAVAFPAELLQDLPDYQIVIVQFAPIGRAFVESAAQLKLIGVLRGGTENIAMQFATDRGVCVMNTPGRNARAVAECAVGLILTEIRNLARAHAQLINGRWTRDFPNSDTIPELGGKTVGLVGYGAVAQLVAQFLRGFDSLVIAYDPYFEGDSGCTELVSLDKLLERSDVVSLHARLTNENHHLIGREQLRRMKPTAILVNTARSGLVDEMALVAALQEKRIMGAALDVFDTEPLPADHPLLQLDRVTLVPHLAGSTIDAFRNSPRMMAEHLTRLFQGSKDLPIVNGIMPDLGSLPK